MIDEERTSMTEESPLKQFEEAIEGMQAKIQALENEVRTLQTKLVQLEQASK